MLLFLGFLVLEPKCLIIPVPCFSSILSDNVKKRLLFLFVFVVVLGLLCLVALKARPFRVGAPELTVCRHH